MRERPKPPKPYKIERAHRRGCRAWTRAREEGGSPYVTLAPGDAAEVFCNRFANPHVQHGRYCYYVRFRCNDIQCESTVLVHAETMLDRLFSEGARDA